MSELPGQPSEGELIFYQTPEGNVRVEVLFELETFWLNQKRIAELFGVDVRTISEHLASIYDAGKLNGEATIRNIRRVQMEGNRDAIQQDKKFESDFEKEFKSIGRIRYFPTQGNDS